MRSFKLFLVALILINTLALAAQANPFTGKTGDRQSLSAQRGSELYQKSSLWHTMAKWQKEMTSQLNRLLKNLKNSFSFKYLLILISISILFGIIHAIGPGHGKMIVSAYFLKEKASSLTAIKIGITLAATHSGLAILLGILFGFLLKSIKMQGRAEFQSYVGIAGGVLITLLGIYYLWKKIWGTEHNHHHKNELLVGVFGGLVPCPISMTIILFSIYLDVFWFGLISVVMFSVGMAGTISLLGIITIKSRNLVSRINFINPKKALLWQKIFGIVTSLLIIFIGVNIILAQL